jgi:hypothetical protein
MISQFKATYDETAIKPYQLPELLLSKSGEKIKNTMDWEEIRRPEILQLFKDQVYGSLPEAELSPISPEIIEQDDAALDNTAIRKQITLQFKTKNREISIDILLYLPKGVKNPPVFVGYNFYGNHSISNDQHIILSKSWVRNNADYGITENRSTEASRGKRSSRWAIDKIIAQGFGLATIYYGDVDPDKNDFTDGIHPLFYAKDQDKPKEDEWGSISAWAWGYSRILETLKSDMLLENSKFIVFGHSRLGKTSLWAGALDPRFDLVISNNSGCGGAALFRRKIGETAARINNSFPHWFNTNFKKYSDHESDLPIDQHMLIALMAPRPIYIASAEEDKWADPKGEFLSGFYASPVYELYGKSGLSNATMPKISDPIHSSIGYHIRPGKHDVTEYDWEQYMKFAKIHFSE